MYRKSMMSLILVACCFLFQNISFARDSGGGSNGDMKSVCELAGGTFTGGVEGSWACCWANWGCAGCQQGTCTVKCHTQRCRRANGQSTLQPGNTRVKGFEKYGIMPIVPKMSTKPSPSAQVPKTRQ